MTGTCAGASDECNTCRFSTCTDSTDCTIEAGVTDRETFTTALASDSWVLMRDLTVRRGLQRVMPVDKLLADPRLDELLANQIVNNTAAFESTNRCTFEAALEFSEHSEVQHELEGDHTTESMLANMWQVRTESLTRGITLPFRRGPTCIAWMLLAVTVAQRW